MNLTISSQTAAAVYPPQIISANSSGWGRYRKEAVAGQMHVWLGLEQGRFEVDCTAAATWNGVAHAKAPLFVNEW